MLSYLTGNVLYQHDTGITDVQTIIDHIETLATSLVPPWTSYPSAGELVSPIDSAGRQMTLLFSRINATTLQLETIDGASRTSVRRAQINGAGTAVDYYIGQFHMVLDWVNVSTAEGFFAIVLDETPENQTSHDKWLVMNGSRTTGNSNDSNWLFGTAYLVRSGGVFALLSNGLYAPYYVIVGSGTGNADGLQSRTVGGSNLWTPLIQAGDTVSNVYKVRGKYFQCLTAFDTYTSVGAEVSVPIDESTTGIFRVLNMPAWSPAGVNLNSRMAVRIS
jgi:hypothetical protein